MEINLDRMRKKHNELQQAAVSLDGRDVSEARAMAKEVFGLAAKIKQDAKFLRECKAEYSRLWSAVFLAVRKVDQALKHRLKTAHVEPVLNLPTATGAVKEKPGIIAATQTKSLLGVTAAATPIEPVSTVLKITTGQVNVTDLPLSIQNSNELMSETVTIRVDEALFMVSLCPMKDCYRDWCKVDKSNFQIGDIG
jgi:hypothetical protein